MRNRYVVAGFLVVGLFSARVLLGATDGGVRGRVLVNLQAIEGIPLTLVNVTTGQTYTVRTARDGSYSLSVPNGSYVISSPGGRGLSIGKAPLLIQVTSGRFASANVEMARSLLQAPGGTTIFHNPIACVSTNEFPVFDTTFEPVGSVVSARLYFKSNLSDEWFYTEFQPLTGDFPKYKWTMTPDPANPTAITEGDDIRRKWSNFGEPESIDPGVPPTHRAFLPQIKDDSGITQVTYYIEITLADFTVARTREIPITLTPEGEGCKGFAAPAGVPAQGLSVLTSAGVATTPVGFGTVGLSLVAQAVTTGLTLLPVVIVPAAAEAAGDDPTPTPTPGIVPTPTPGPGPTPTPAPTPTPTPTPTPGPGPTPTPTPTPTPSPAPSSCQLQVSVDPPGGSSNICKAEVHFGETGSTVVVTSAQSFAVACNFGVTVNSILADDASFVAPKAASWGGACTGDAIKSSCVLPPTLPALSAVVLECGCDPGPAEGFTSTPCGSESPKPLRP